jgi:hypothetical protein
MFSDEGGVAEVSSSVRRARSRRGERPGPAGAGALALERAVRALAALRGAAGRRAAFRFETLRLGRLAERLADRRAGAAFRPAFAFRPPRPAFRFAIVMSFRQP